ncbi:acylphosphatase [Endozoicomonas sp. ALD040]|uniref:acylphosphatase n=1 Tax=unclassified Endozoicomonas TaxID=2644528 RepID=UPI003BB19E1B
MANQCRRAMVEGRVQGVWYRGSTQQEARKLGITGWAKNLPDGRVEVLMCGEERELDKLEAWLQSGPPMARVTGVSVSLEPEQEFSEFTTG